MTIEYDIALNENDDIVFENGDFAVEKSLDQEVGIILRLHKGDLKSDPLLGPNLIRMIKSDVSDVELQSVVKLHLARDNKDYEQYRERINIQRQTQ